MRISSDVMETKRKPNNCEKYLNCMTHRSLVKGGDGRYLPREEYADALVDLISFGFVVRPFVPLYT